MLANESKIMSRLPFVERLQQEKPLLADGGMGILLSERVEASIANMCVDALNIDYRGVVRDVHTEYLLAGSELIETNTFGANRIKLAEYDMRDQVETINRAGVMIAKEAVEVSGRNDVYIAGAVGPVGQAIKPYGKLSREDAKSAFQQQMRVLMDAGVDVILLETFADHNELLLAVDACKELDADFPIIAQATFTSDKMSFTGHSPSRVAHDLARSGVTVVGVNCGNGPQLTLQVLEAMRRALPDKPLSALPNAGFPQEVGGRRFIYSATPDYFKDYAEQALGMGATIIGGCCGTTPEHIAAMRAVLDNPVPHTPDIQIQDAGEDYDEKPSFPPTVLEERLAKGQFTVTVEMTPPRSFTPERFLKRARMLRDAGADLIDVADTPAAKMKMSAWAVSHLIQDSLGIETVLHFPTRGRNILRVQGDLLAAHALSLRTLFVTMGDPTKIGDYPDAMDGYDIVPSKLISLIKHEMNDGRDMAGHSIGTPTQFTVGCALNMAADNLDRELKVLNSKLNAGADFALGQAVFDPPRLDTFIERYRERNGEDFKLPVIMGVIPLYSVRHASFLHNEVPGITIPDKIFKRLEDAGDDAPQEGVRIAIELIREMRDRVQGAYIIPSSGRYSLAADVIDAIVSAPVGMI